MRPEEKVILSTRQAGERAERLLEWLDQSRPMLKAQCRALQIEVQTIANELLTIIEAVDQRPTAGLITSWGAPRSALLRALVGITASATVDGEEKPAINRDRLGVLIPDDVGGGLCSSLRLVAAERSETPYRHPIRITLLGQLDLVKIIAAAYLLHVPSRRQSLTAAALNTENLSSTAYELTSQTFTGMSRRDVEDLRDNLHAVAPDSEALRAFESSGYWDSLASLAPHLSEAGRRKAFALLWGNDPQLTILFDALSDGIEQMGFSGEAFAGLDALLGRDQTTGWMTRNTESVISNSTIENWRRRPDAQIRVSSRHGRGTDVDRTLLAALSDECCLPVASADLPLLETADMLVLPSSRPVMLWPVAGRQTHSAIPSIGALSASEALEIFIAQKAHYLTQRAIRRHSLTSLVVATDIVGGRGEARIDAATNELIADWVGNTQGETPHARELRRTGLSILAIAPLENSSARNPIIAGTDETDPRLAATTASVLNDNKEWTEEWTPNRPFRNVFTWQPPQPVHAAPDGQQWSADVIPFERGKSAEAGGTAPPAAILSISQDLANLHYAILQSTTATIHIQQLSARLAKLRRTLASRFLRLHLANDPSLAVEWRRKICHAAHSRLQSVAQIGAFGRFQKTLLFRESDAEAVIARLKAEYPSRSSHPRSDLRTLDPTRIVEASFETWIVSMRRTVRAPALVRSINLPGTLLAHIIDEIVLGSLRIGLPEKLSEAVRRIQLSAQRAIDCERSVAALLERGIGTYVEALDPAARSLRDGPHRDTRFGMSAPGRLRHEGGRAQGSTMPAPINVADEWAESFVDLVEANILGASLLGGTGHLNRELGEVLNAMSVNLTEGAQ